MPSEFFSGIPIAVDPERIEREISSLWKTEPEPSTATRVCLSNVLFYLPDRETSRKARDLLPGVGRHFPSRMILLTHGDPSATAPLSAWVTAVCHLAERGGPPVCCDEIILEAPERSPGLFPGAVLPLLVPDVPTMLVLLSLEGEQLLEMLREVVDRVVFDSRDLEISALSRVQKRLLGGLDADDLAWRAITGWRRVICDIFDDLQARPLLGKLRRIEVEYQEPAAGAGGRSRGAARAALLGGWLASRLGFAPSPDPGSGPLTRVLARDGETLLLSLRPGRRAGIDPGRFLSINLVMGEGPDGEFVRVSRACDESVLRVEYRAKLPCVIPGTIPCRREPEADVLGSALERPTHREVFLDALSVACDLG